MGRPETLVGMGGAVTNLAAVSLGMTEYEPDRIQGFELTRAEVEGQIARYAALDSTGRCDIPGLQPGRAEVILAGALIVLSLLRKLEPRPAQGERSGAAPRGADGPIPGLGSNGVSRLVWA